MTAFIPLVPLASSGGRGRLSHRIAAPDEASGHRKVVVVQVDDMLGDVWGVLDAVELLHDRLGLLVARVGLAGEDELDAALPGE
jgi:hypothetical protein